MIPQCFSNAKTKKKSKKIACLPCRSLSQTDPLLKTQFPWVVHYAQPTGISLNAEDSGTKSCKLAFPLVNKALFWVDSKK